MSDLSYEQVRSILRTMIQQVWVANGKPSTVDELRDMLLKVGADDEQIVAVFKQKGFDIQNKNTPKPRDIPGTTLGANTPIEKEQSNATSKKISMMASRLDKDLINQLLTSMNRS